MAGTYITIQGDTWDIIALKVYGGEEFAAYLIENNYRHLDTLIFSAGIILNTPELPVQYETDLPPWREDGEDDEEEDPYDDYSDEEDDEDDYYDDYYDDMDDDDVEEAVE